MQQFNVWEGHRWRLVCWLDFNPTSIPDATHRVTNTSVA